MKYKKDLLFVLLIILISVFYNYPSILNKDAYSIHQWRQADCLSLTMSYYNNAPFLEPSIYWIGRNNDSHTISEFPAIYYIVGNIWKITGKKIFIFRLINVLIVFFGLFALFKVSYKILKDNFWAFFIPVFLFTSPVLVYYSNNFLMDAPAFGLVLVAWYFYFDFFKNKRKIAFVISMLFFLFAGLLKISSLLSFFALIALEIIRLFNFNFLKELPKQKNKVLIFSSFIFVLLVIFLWYSYARNFNSKHLNGIFLQSLFPIWDIKTSRLYFSRNLYNKLIPSFFNLTALTFTILSFIFTLLNFKKSNKILNILSSLIFVGAFIFILLFFKAFTVHDYYLTNLLIFIPFALIGFFMFLKQNFLPVFNDKYIKIVSLIFLLFLIYETGVINRIKYNSHDIIAKNSFLLDNNEIDYWKWYHNDYSSHFKALETIQPYLLSIGVKKTDTIISLPDNSINISLYLMQRKGFTNFGHNEYKNYNEKIPAFIKSGAKLLIINDTTLLTNKDIEKYTHKLIGKYKNIKIYDLR